MITLFLLEGLGILSVYKNAPYLYILLPGIFYVFFEKNRKIKWPVLATASYFIFIFFTFISSIFFAVNKQASFERSIFYLSSFLIFIYFYNQKAVAVKYISKLLIWATPIFLGVFLIMTFLFKKWIGNFYITETPYNLVVAIFSDHNHLGDFLGLVLIYLLFNKEIKTKLKPVMLIPIFILFILSFSRSAYLAFVVILLLTSFVKNKRISLGINQRVVIFFLSLLILVFGFIFLPNIGRFFPGANNRSLVQRYQYWMQAKKSVIKKPFFGAGAGNFESISNLYREKIDDWTNSAHSLLIEVLSGHGILAFAGFVLFFTLIFISLKKEISPFSLLFLYLFINFETDYIYQINSLFILLMILAAVFYNEKRNIEGKTVYGVLSIFLIWAVILITVSAFLFAIEQPRLAIYFYPLNKLARQKLINNDQKEKRYLLAKEDAGEYERLFPEDIETNIFLAGFYADLGSEQKAKELYEKSYKLNKFINFDYISKIYQQKTKVELDKEADNFIHYQININYPLRYFYEPASKTITQELNKYLLTTRYSINNDSFNERFDYPEEKKEGVFRILVIGDSFTYGRYINTAENWTELLEDKLNQNNSCRGIKKFEVINLGVNGYDPQYTVVRYKKRGIKYNPDLIIWPVGQYYFERIYEETRPIVRQLQASVNDSSSKIWERAKKQVDAKWGKENIMNYQKKHIRELANSYKKGFLIVEIDGEKANTNKILSELGKTNKLDFFINNLTGENYFPGTQLLNPPGSKLFSDKLNEFIQTNNLVKCDF